MKRILLAAVAVALVIGPLLGCAWFSKNGPAVATDVGGLVSCVLQHDTEQPAQIAVDCGGVAVEDIIAILAASKARMARANCEMSVAGARASLTGPGK